MKRRMGVLLLGLIVLSASGCGIGSTSAIKPAESYPETTRNSSIVRSTPPADDYEQLGDTYARQRNWAMALLQYDRAVKAVPHRARVRHKKALMQLANGLTADAIAGLRSLVRDEPHDGRVWEGLGRALLHAGKEREAEEALRQAVYENARLWRAHALLGMLYARRQEWDRALAAYRTALELKPDRPDLRNNLGHAYYLMGDYPRAIEEFKAAKTGPSSEAIVQNNLGLALAKTGAYREALAAFRLGGTEAQAFTNLGIVYLEAGQAAQAARCFQKAIDANPRFDGLAADLLETAHASLRGHTTDLTPQRASRRNPCS